MHAQMFSVRKMKNVVFETVTYTFHHYRNKHGHFLYKRIHLNFISLQSAPISDEFSRF
jgi:hypothetical protein